MSPPLLAVEDLTTVFRTDKETIRAVDGVSFKIERGETLGIVGESGSGKSVTARSIMGLVDAPGRIAETSSVRLDGEELNTPDTDWTEVRGGRIALVFQDPMTSLNPVYTVGNQIKESLLLHRGLRGREATEEATELLRAVGIPDPARRLGEYPHQFSGGMLQRAVIAMALACDPDLLICDEPTTALDVTIQAQVLELLAELRAEQELAVLFITHDMHVIAEIADRVGVMYAGEIVETGPVDAVFDDPAHPYAEGLLSCIPSRNVGRDRLDTIEGDVPTPTEPPSACRFAPRCPAAFDACERVHPQRVPIGSEDDDGDADGSGNKAGGPADGSGADRDVACLLYPENESRSDRVRHHDRDGDAPDGGGHASNAGGRGPDIEGGGR